MTRGSVDDIRQAARLAGADECRVYTVGPGRIRVAVDGGDPEAVRAAVADRLAAGVTMDFEQWSATRPERYLVEVPR